MRHFTTNLVTSVIIKHKPSAAMQRDIVREFMATVEIEPGAYLDVNLLISEFVFDGSRSAVKDLREWGLLAPAEFRAIVEFRKWYKVLARQLEYCSPRFYTRCGDFVYCNVNSGKCIVLIDGHYWD